MQGKKWRQLDFKSILNRHRVPFDLYAPNQPYFPILVLLLCLIIWHPHVLLNDFPGSISVSGCCRRYMGTVKLASDLQVPEIKHTTAVSRFTFLTIPILWLPLALIERFVLKLFQQIHDSMDTKVNFLADFFTFNWPDFEVRPICHYRKFTGSRDSQFSHRDPCTVM